MPDDVSNRKPEVSKQKRGEMIAVCSAKGGVGRTVMAINLAVALSKNNIQISVMDGNFQFGDVCLAMDLQSTFSIKDVVEEINSLDAYSLSNYLIHHSSGVKVLSAPDRPEFADMITLDVINKVTDMLLSQQDYLIVDTGVGLQEQSLQFIEKSDQVFVLTNLEMATIKNTKMMLETLELLGLRDKVQVVVNRSTMESVISAADVPEILEIETPIYIPNHFQIVSQSLNIGVPFVMNHAKTDVAKAVFKMAEQMISRREIGMFQPKPTSFLQSFFKNPKMV